MDPIAEGDVTPCIGPIDDELIRVGKLVLIPVPGEIPHADLFSGNRLLIPELRIYERTTAHVGEGVCQRMISATMLGMRL